MSLCADVIAVLTGTISNLYEGNMPPDPVNSVGIYHTGGYDRSMSGTEVEEPTFQVRVRNSVYATGLALCETIKDTLHGYVGGHFLMIAQQSDILDLGRDANDHNEWTINFRCYYRR